jgi:hypothetical protein
MFVGEVSKWGETVGEGGEQMLSGANDRFRWRGKTIAVGGGNIAELFLLEAIVNRKVSTIPLRYRQSHFVGTNHGSRL